MATDLKLLDTASDDTQSWAPGHAWRALAQLRAAEAAEPLARLFSRVDAPGDDFLREDLPEAFGMLGAVAIPPLMAYLADEANGLWGRAAAGRGLEKIGTRHPEAREAAVAVLAGQLGLFARQDPALNGSLVAHLLDLKAVEAAEVMQHAFAAGMVDEMVTGGWEDVQKELGLEAPPAGTPPAAAAQYTLKKAVRPAPRPQLSAQEQIRAGLASTLSDPDLDVVPGPKRKHHRKPK